MKHILILSALFITVSVSGQFVAGIGVGYGTEKSPTVDLRLKYSAGVFVQGGFALNTTAQVKAGAIFYGGAGYDFRAIGLTFSPMAGYGHTLRSNDRKWLNTSSYVIGLTVYKKAGEYGKIYISAITTKEQTIFTLGVAGVIGDNY